MIKKNVFKTGKQLSKQATMLAMAGMLLANPMSVLAQDIDASTTSSGSTTATLTIDQETANELGLGLVVTIPNELNLSYSAENSEFSASETVQAKGAVEVDNLLIVKAPTIVNYANQDKSTVTVEGAVSFGTGGTEMWTADELYNGVTTPDKRNIKASVSKDAIKYKGTYKTEITFSIDVSTVDDYWKTNAASLFRTSSLGDGTLQITGLTSEGEAFLNNAASGRLVIPATIDDTAVSQIGSGAFAGYTFTDIVVSEGITSVAFQMVTSNNIELPTTVNSAGDAFAEASITNITLAEGTTTIPDKMFKRSMSGSISNVNVPVSVTSISASAFGDGTSTSNTMARTITYAGTMEQWNNIGYVKPSGLATITVHCTDGDLTL